MLEFLRFGSAEAPRCAPWRAPLASLNVQQRLDLRAYVDHDVRGHCAMILGAVSLPVERLDPIKAYGARDAIRSIG